MNDVTQSLFNFDLKGGSVGWLGKLWSYLRALCLHTVGASCIFDGSTFNAPQAYVPVAGAA